MALAGLHADQIPASRMVGQSIRKAGDAAYVTDQNVIDATNTADLKTNITNVAVHSELVPLKSRLKTALDIGNADTTLADAAVAAATGYNNLATLTASTPGKIGPAPSS